MRTITLIMLSLLSHSLLAQLRLDSIKMTITNVPIFHCNDSTKEVIGDDEMGPRLMIQFEIVNSSDSTVKLNELNALLQLDSRVGNRSIEFSRRLILERVQFPDSLERGNSFQLIVEGVYPFYSKGISQWQKGSSGAALLLQYFANLEVRLLIDDETLTAPSFGLMSIR